MKLAFYGLVTLALAFLLVDNREDLYIGRSNDQTQYITRGRFKIPTPREFVAQETTRVFGKEHLTAMDNLVIKESNYDPTIKNKMSGAAGIPQAYPREKLPCKLSWEWNDYRCQVNWMINYIKNRYGNPVNAWNYHLVNNSY